MNKFELTMRHTVAIVSYIAASMGYSKEEIKYIAGNMKFGSDDIGEFQEILAEPLDDIHSVKYNGEVKDLVGSFNLTERIQMVIDLILKKSNLEDGDDLPMKSYLSATVSAYKNSPFKFSNFIRNPEEEPGMTAHEEYLVDEAIRKATEETIRDLKGKEVEIEKFDEERLEELKQLDELVKQRVEEELQKRENLEKERLDEEHRKEMFEETMARINGSARFSRQENVYSRPFYSRPFSQGNQQTRPDFTPGFNPLSPKYIVNEIDEINQVIDNLISFRDRLIAKLGYDQFKEKEQQTNWDDVQKAQEQPEPFEPVKFTEEQRKRQREILGNTDGTTSRYNDAANQYVEKARKAEEERKKEREMEIQNQSKDSEDTKETIEVRFYNSTEEANLVKESIKIERTSRSSTWCDGMHIAAGSFNGHVVEIFPKEILHKLSEDLSKRTPNELFSFICGDADNLYIDNDQLTFPKLSLSANGLSPRSIAVVTTTRGDNGKGLISVKVDVDRLIKLIDISKEDIADTLKAVSNKHQIDLSKGSIVVNGTLLNTTYIRVMRKLQDERVKEVLKLIEKAVKNIFNNRKLTNWLLAGADF